MAVILPEELQKEIDAHPNRPAEVVDPRTGQSFRLVPSDQYEKMKDHLEQEAWHRTTAATMAKRLAEGE
jgi:hypothetical protein